MAVADLSDWLDEFTGERFIWYVKRLAGNDTLANGSHQAGPYIPKSFLFSIFPNLNQPEIKNPRIPFDIYIDSHADSKKVMVIWYNNKFHDGTRNEARMTNFGGGASALLDPESTGALTVFAFVLGPHEQATECHVWVCRNEVEEDLVEDRVGPIEPGKWALWSPKHALVPTVLPVAKPCYLSPEDIPPEWLAKFPTGVEIIDKTVNLRPDVALAPDKRLMRRRECEFNLFQSVEEAIELPVIKKGFDGIEDFLARAQTILQRRKSRSGRSLELHARRIFLEEEMVEERDFSHQPESEKGQRPDFLFPSEADYKNKDYPESKLRMLGVKTTCKDRWRQILQEAERVREKHLLTLQEGVSVNQFNEMKGSGVQLVVPESLIDSYPKEVRGQLQTFESFIGDVRFLKPPA